MAQNDGGGNARHPLIRAGAKITGRLPSELVGPCTETGLSVDRQRVYLAGRLAGISVAEIARIVGRTTKPVRKGADKAARTGGTPIALAIAARFRRLSTARDRSIASAASAAQTPVSRPASPVIEMAVAVNPHRPVWETNRDIALARRDNIHRW